MADSMRWLCALAILLAANAQAAEITIVSRNPAVVLVDGHINHGDDAKFVRAVEGLRAATVYLSSDGGYLLPGVMIGFEIRKRGFSTAVKDYQECVSVCAMAWLGGVHRFLGSYAMLGFHAPYVRSTIKRSDTGWTYETPEDAMRFVSNYITMTLSLRKEVVGYVTPADKWLQLTYLDEEDGKRYGIEFEQRSIPTYDPLL